MKVSDHLLKEILEGTTHEFETMGVWVKTEYPKEEGFCLDYRYNEIDNDIDKGTLLFMGDNPVTLTKEQTNILFLHAVDLHNQELESEEENKKRSSDGYADDGYYLFI